MFARKFQQRNLVEEQSSDNGQQIPQANTENASGDGSGQHQAQAGAEEKRFTQAELEAAIKERLERAKKQAEEAQKKAADEAEAKRLQENQQFKELSEKQAKDLLDAATEKAALTTQITTLETELAQLQKLFEGQLAEQKKTLPEPVVKLLNGLPLLEQLAWINENGVKLGAASTKGVPPSPRGNGTNNNGKAEEAAREGMRQFYRNF